MQPALLLLLFLYAFYPAINRQKAYAEANKPGVVAFIQGYVFDAETETPVEAASVYLSYTLLGSATSSAGYFYIGSIIPGVYELIVSRIGYESKIFQIDISDEQYSDSLIVYLQPAVYSLGELEIVARASRRWARRFDLFNKLLLGTMAYEERAVIRNPYVVDFQETRSELRAVAREPLVIDNMGLGYIIQFQLMGFVWNKRDDILNFTCTAFFEEMVPENEEEAAKWQTQRDRAYTWLVWPHPPERVMKGSCRCRPARFGFPDRAVCGCYYKWLDTLAE